MKQMICALTTSLGLLIAFAPQAEAHGFSRTVVVHEGKVVRKFRPAYPHWLRAQRGFHHWYQHSRYYHQRYQRHPNWHRLYKLYRQDVRYYRELRRDLRRHQHKHRGHRQWRECRHH